MSGNVSVTILTILVPALLAIGMGILGLLRGARREAVVSASIVLAFAVLTIWGTSWAIDLRGIFSGLSVPDARNILAYLVLLLTVLVLGYALGSAVVARGPVNPLSRLGGLLLGIGNGLAISGFLVGLAAGGFYVTNLFGPSPVETGSNSSELATAIADNNIGSLLWIWANWFPLAMALVAGVVALVGPFRRTQAVVATPSARTDWGPSAATATDAIGAAPTASPGPAAYTTGYGQGFTNQFPQQPAQPNYGPNYGPSQAPTQPYVQPPQGQQPYNPYPPLGQQPHSNQYAGSPAPAYTPPYTPPATQSGRLEDAPPTAMMSPSDQPRNVPQGGQETHYFGTTSSTPSSGSSNSSGSGSAGSQGSTKAPDWAGFDTPSWLIAPAAGSALNPAPGAPGDGTGAGPSPSSPQLDNDLIARAEAPTQAQSIVPPVAPISRNKPADTGPLHDHDSEALGASSTVQYVSCSNCGTMVPSDATFCTECGNRMNRA